ncbi:MAG: DUF3108 domain-containing protein [Gammaproteobacteria bacterium]|nr:DUF3108 domain-containing protein [Gammaproteobacteria bacterium]
MAGRLTPLLPLALAVAWPAQGLDLEYRGVIGGTEAGSAYVRVESDGERYRVRGMMRTHGVWDVLAPWNARFVVTGRIEGGRVTPEALVLHEKDRRKDRTIRVADGVLRQLKDGKLRPERPAPAGVDLMSALWVRARCEAEQVLNNGRHYYTMTRTAHAVGDDGVERCEYAIVDDDGERSKGRIELAERGGRHVPLLVTIDAGIARGLELVRAGAEPLIDDWEDAPVPAALALDREGSTAP